MGFCLQAYLGRIGYKNRPRPNLECLNGIVAGHARKIPFENLDVLLGRPIDLEPAALMHKLVHQGRGGYCFEQNRLLMLALQEIGFECTPLSARVRLQRSRQETPARTHLFLSVLLEGQRWLVDVGLGGMTLTSALRWVLDEPQETPHETRRLVQEESRIFHQVWLGREWSDACEFTGEEMPEIDRVVANWYTSTHPQSHFRHRLMVARAGSDGRRYNLLNDRFSIREREGQTRVQSLNSWAELWGTLALHFDLHFPPETCFENDFLPFSSQA